MFGQRLSTNSLRSKSGSRPQQTSMNDNPHRGTTLAVRSVGALESRHARALESPRDGSHGDSSRIAHRDVTTYKCISLGAHYAPRSYPPPEGYTSSPQCPLCSKPHFLKDCITFRAKTYQERLDVLFQKHICRNCLVPCHYAKGCAAVGCVKDPVA